MKRETFPLRLELWDAAFGPEVALEEEPKEGEVVTDLELPLEEWRPIPPGRPAFPRKLLFIDGVRRIEERVVLPGEPLVYGALASYAVGAVEVDLRTGKARFGPFRVERLLILGGGRDAPPFRLSSQIQYRPVSDLENSPEMPPRKLQELMRLGEQRLAEELLDQEALLLFDGPLAHPFRAYPSVPSGEGVALGYVKRISRFYLPDLALLRQLPAGHRTPLFSFHRPTFRLYSWFLRLADPGPLDSPFSGLVRLELSSSCGLERARRLADLTAALLCRFQGQKGRDPRAPQNLMPVGALEQRLRHLLGDERLIRREIHRLLMKKAFRPLAS